MSQLKAIVLAGITGAILIDLYLVVLHAGILHDATAQQVSQWDASNLLGRSAFRGGFGSAALGAAMHAIVSLAWAAIYVVAARRVPDLLRHPVLCGTIFGIIVMAVMRVDVVPLGNAAALPPIRPLGLFELLVAHTVFFGIPVALVVRRFLPARA